MITFLKKENAQTASVTLTCDPGDFDAAQIADLKVKAEKAGYEMRTSYTVSDRSCTVAITFRRAKEV